MSRIQTTGGKEEPQRTSQHGTHNVKTHKRTAQTAKKYEQYGYHENNRELFLLLVRHPPCYSYIQSSPVKVLALIEKRKHLRIK
jgi:hypothetical protein